VSRVRIQIIQFLTFGGKFKKKMAGNLKNGGKFKKKEGKLKNGAKKHHEIATWRLLRMHQTAETCS
jgi:hypothetical protein